jgi:hypothetical protein
MATHEPLPAHAAQMIIAVDVPRALVDAEQHRDDLEIICAVLLPMLATGTRRAELLRRLRGYEPRETWEATP